MKAQGDGGQGRNGHSSVRLISSPSPLLALLLSLLVHGLLAAGLVLYFDYAPAPDELARLDLTSVELSFAETPDDTAAAARGAAPMPQAVPPVPKDVPTAPETVPTAEPAMPPPDIADLPKPGEPREQFEVKAIVRPTATDQPPAPAAAPRQAKVDALPELRQSIRPDYPRAARLRGEQGDVTVEIDVSAAGTVADVRVVGSSGFPLLDEAAVAAVRPARFTPAKSAGAPVPSAARLTLTFRLK